jgi:hypothetical protein
MTQTATFPDLESFPNVSTQAILYFSSTMGTLTEVDLVTSGSFSTEFSAENLGSSSSTIKGVTAGNLSINGPTGAIPVAIPPVTETVNAARFDGTVDYAGQSGKDLAPVTSNSVAQTTVLTSPAQLAAFTGHFRIPITVSGHASGTATAANGELSAGFKTQTSATLTVIYHYIPNLPSLDPPPASSPVSQPPNPTSSGPAAGPTAATTATSPAASTPVQITVTQPATESVHKKGANLSLKHPAHKVAHPVPRKVSHMHGMKANANLLSAHPRLNISEFPAAAWRPIRISSRRL